MQDFWEKIWAINSEKFTHDSFFSLFNELHYAIGPDAALNCDLFAGSSVVCQSLMLRSVDSGCVRGCKWMKSRCQDVFCTRCVPSPPSSLWYPYSPQMWFQASGSSSDMEKRSAAHGWDGVDLCVLATLAVSNCA